LYNFCDPAAAHARQHTGLAIGIAQVRWRLGKISPAGPENFRGRDLMKVEAQYEVLGMKQKTGPSRQGR